MPKVTGVILAGGSGVRLGGVRKSGIRVGGVALLERVHAAVSAQCDAVLVAAGSSPPHPPPGTAANYVPDAPGPPAGPLSGLAGAVEWLRSHGRTPDFLLTCAVDTPFFPQDFRVRAFDKMTAASDVVFGCAGEQLYPTNALWRFAALAALPARLARGDTLKGFRAVLPGESTTICPFPAAALANINTLGDLLACQRRLREDGHANCSEN